LPGLDVKNRGWDRPGAFTNFVKRGEIWDTETTEAAAAAEVSTADLEKCTLQNAQTAVQTHRFRSNHRQIALSTVENATRSANLGDSNRLFYSFREGRSGVTNGNSVGAPRIADLRLAIADFFFNLPILNQQS
jgi:hypothetical protein